MPYNFTHNLHINLNLEWEKMADVDAVFLVAEKLGQGYILAAYDLDLNSFRVADHLVLFIELFTSLQEWNWPLKRLKMQQREATPVALLTKLKTK